MEQKKLRKVLSNLSNVANGREDFKDGCLLKSNFKNLKMNKKLMLNSLIRTFFYSVANACGKKNPK
jgi:hypothetical protein